jgi:hypothetical protein
LYNVPRTSSSGPLDQLGEANVQDAPHSCCLVHPPARAVRLSACVAFWAVNILIPLLLPNLPFSPYSPADMPLIDRLCVHVTITTRRPTHAPAQLDPALHGHGWRDSAGRGPHMRRRLPVAQGARHRRPSIATLISLSQAGDRVAVWIRDCNPEDEVLQAAVYDVAYAMKVRTFCGARAIELTRHRTHWPFRSRSALCSSRTLASPPAPARLRLRCEGECEGMWRSKTEVLFSAMNA